MAIARATKKYAVQKQRMSWDSITDRTAALNALDGQVDHILGSDILDYTLSQPRLPLIAAKDVMERSSSCRSDVSFWCVINTRLGSSQLNSVRSLAENLDLKLTEIPPYKFMPVRPFPPPLNTFQRGDLVLLRFQLLFPN